jgi:hypothetical protein
MRGVRGHCLRQPPAEATGGSGSDGVGDEVHRIAQVAGQDRTARGPAQPGPPTTLPEAVPSVGSAASLAGSPVGGSREKTKTAAGPLRRTASATAAAGSRLRAPGWRSAARPGRPPARTGRGEQLVLGGGEQHRPRVHRIGGGLLGSAPGPRSRNSHVRAVAGATPSLPSTAATVSIATGRWTGRRNREPEGYGLHCRTSRTFDPSTRCHRSEVPGPNGRPEPNDPLMKRSERLCSGPNRSVHPAVLLKRPSIARSART